MSDTSGTIFYADWMARPYNYKNSMDYEMLANMSDHGKPPELLTTPSRAILHDSYEEHDLPSPTYIWNTTLVQLDDPQHHQSKYLV